MLYLTERTVAIARRGGGAGHAGGTSPGLDRRCDPGHGAGAGAGFGPALELTEDVRQDVVDIDLTGVWKTAEATAPATVERGQGGSIVLPAPSPA